VDPEFIHCENGTENALDFQLTTYLGFLASKNPKDHLVVISKDKGFDAVIHFWTERGYQVARNTPSMFHTLSEPESEPEGTVKPKSVSSPADNTDSDLKQPTLTEEQKQQLDTLLACTGKEDLSAVHNILRSIYGQETGGFLYNQIKKASYEIATVNWQKKTKYRKYLHIVYSNAGAKLSCVELLFPPTATLPQIKFSFSYILSILACCFLRHVFICPLDHFHSFLYSLFVTNRKRERTAPPTVRSFSHTQVLQKQVPCRVMP